MTADINRCRALVRGLADQAREIAVDGATTRPRVGERRFCLVEMLPVAAVLLGEGDTGVQTPPPTDGSASVTDGAGHWRPVYRFLAAYLHARAGGAGGLVALQPREEGDLSLRLWQAVTAAQAGVLDADAVDRWLGGDHGSLQPQDPDEAPDHWTYRELTGLHALHVLARRTGRRAWAERVADAARFHQANTQPDYTTYQPWALSAFWDQPDTRPFVEQQLHDVASHLSVAGGPGAVVPALLLADAHATLSDLGSV